MKCLLSIFLVLITCFPTSAQHVAVMAQTSDVPASSFIGGSTEFMYPILEGRISPDSARYDSVWFGNGVMDALIPLQNNFLRFPGGTISQFYHFRGEHGYGTTAFDLECRPGFLNLPAMIEKVRVDPFYPENMIDRYIAMAKELDSHTSEDIQTLFVINLMTHFFNGDLLPWNSYLDDLITNYGTSIAPYLDQYPSIMDDQAMNEAVTVMENIYSDPAIDNLIVWLVQQPGFQERAAENLEAIAYLIEHDIAVAGVELGNENYAFTMLKDDDLSHIPFDCTTPDSIVANHWPIRLPLRAYMQAILKYSMLSSVYSSLVKDLWDLPTGAVVNGTVFDIETLSFDEFNIVENTSERSRYFELWNRFIGGRDHYDAVIPHIYMRSLPECDVLEEIEVDSIAKFGKHYLDFYFKDVLGYQLDAIKEQVSDHPMWITEWNINTANIFGNTFLHASHCFQFMNNMNNIAEAYDIRLINYHNLASWVYNQFALIRTEDIDDTFTVNLQSTYHPFKIMGEIHAGGAVRCSIDLDQWLGDERLEAPEHYFYSYMSDDGRKLIVNYINQSSTYLHIPLEDVAFSLEIDGIRQPDMTATSYRFEYMDGSSLFASNRGCDEYPEYFDNYTWIEKEGDGSFIAVPSYSLGKLTLDLEVLTGSADLERVHGLYLYPNPATDYLNIKVKGLEQLSGPLIEMSDIAGKVVQSQRAQNLTRLHLSELATGLYIIRLRDANGLTYAARKLVVNGGD